jgi:hypothetical protein
MKNSKFTPAASSSKMSAKDAARIQSVQAKANGGLVAKGTFAARAISAAAKNADK